MPDPTAVESSLREHLTARIERLGPLPVAEYMALANAHYYATRDPLGAAGDFITAPEISQMFGELVGAWLADLWQRSGRLDDCHYVELGPGRGTLAADALRALRPAGLAPEIHLVETSPVLRRLQQERLGQVQWHDSVATLSSSGPLLIVANEFFDALPVRQFVNTRAGWRERCIGTIDGSLIPVAGPEVGSRDIPAQLRDAPVGAIWETSPASLEIVADLSRRIATQGGALLAIDYGHARTTVGDTLQAMRAHRYADPWNNPGEVDLTAHVDFEALMNAGSPSGLNRYGPTEQGRWLRALGIGARADALAGGNKARAAEIKAARDRLVQDDQMGSLFKVAALVSPTWAEPAGFA